MKRNTKIVFSTLLKILSEMEHGDKIAIATGEVEACANILLKKGESKYENGRI